MVKVGVSRVGRGLLDSPLRFDFAYLIVILI